MRHREDCKSIVRYTERYTAAHPLPNVNQTIVEDGSNLSLAGELVHKAAYFDRMSKGYVCADQLMASGTKEQIALYVMASHTGSIGQSGSFLTTNAYVVEGVGAVRYTTKLYKEGELFGLKLTYKRPRALVSVLVKEWRPSKLTRLLSKLGVVEKFITELATKMSNKPRTYSIEVTNMYIPEHYQLLGQYQSLTSCMSKDSSDYDLNGEGEGGWDLHPTMVYENSPNVLLGLLRDNSSTKAYPYVARFMLVVDGDEVKTSRVYGLERAEGLIKDAGITLSGLYGGKLSKIEARGTYLMPYLDGATSYVADTGSHFTVDGDGEYEAQSECGVLEDPSVECEHCGDHCSEDEMATMHVSGSELRCCEGCREDGIYIEDLDEYHHYNDVVELDCTYYSGRWGAAVYDLYGDCTETNEGWIRDSDCVEFEGEAMHVDKKYVIVEEREEEAAQEAEYKLEEQRMKEEEAA